ncbi:MAG TPA: glycerophosphoryl diester phosphodiesterase membrane domain-containing protein, partial [Sphingomicrobium sp.]
CVPIAVIAALLGVPVPQAGDKPSGPLLLLSMGLVVIALALWARFVIFPAIAVGEKLGPVALLKRSWSLTKGSYWRLLAFVMLLLIFTIVLMAAAGALGGILGSLASEGQVQALSLGALLLALTVAAASGVLSLVGSVMVAHIYGQLAGADQAVTSVPKAAAD